MSEDGRLTIRFKGLLREIERVAKQDKRTAGDWIRLQIEIALEKQRKVERKKV